MAWHAVRHMSMPKAKIPEKVAESRTETPSVRMSKNDKKRVEAAAKHMKFAAYTEFMYRAVMNTVEQVEAEMKKKRGRK